MRHYLIFKKLPLILALCFALNLNAQNIPTDDASIEAGKALFQNNCTQCHEVSDKVVIGPGLKGVTEERPTAWLLKWIKNSSLVIASGDAYANEIFNKFGKVQMQSFAFSDKEITSILAYVKKQSSQAAPPAAATASASTSSSSNTAQASSQDTTTITYILIFFVVVLVLILIILVLIISILTKYLKGKEDLTDTERDVVNTKIDFSAVYNSGAFKTILVSVFLLVVGKACMDGMLGIGVTQGYAPRQPIMFSHKLHAGEQKINCNYCHTGVYKSKAANIPSVNICMNCHNAIKQESPEIQKLYKAIETGRPIEWVRVHNLPDLAYFNHSQHTSVGNIQCQQCHGPVETMEMVEQYAPLTMGWCIDCHRQTSVNSKGNAYYESLSALHAKNSKEPLKVKDIGGLECSKCHY